ncbi:unnamed protein product [Nyctereutes procyonoides]|uniref:(raccoon dog) hypothetical protein n=1 Tax=Nyctereutes procyonoides TaxID=34880 RepID=A0A811XXL4_NYCPR|nr:unnamed protein product [Nyctereutes procyonoides]
MSTMWPQLSMLDNTMGPPLSPMHLNIPSVCLSLTDLIHLALHSLVPFMSLQMARFHSSLWLKNIPLCNFICFFYGCCLQLQPISLMICFSNLGFYSVSSGCLSGSAVECLPSAQGMILEAPGSSPTSGSLHGACFSLCLQRGCRMAPMSPDNSGYGSPGKRLRQVDFWPTPHCGEIFPRFGLPKVIGSDNSPAFVSQVSQLVARLLGINWKLHCAYRPQSSGQVERMNRTIKETLTKLTLETGTRDWVQLLPMVLFRVRNTPARHGLTPYEILYGGPPPVTDLLDSALDPLANTPGLQDRLKALQIIQHQIWKPLAAVYRPGDTPAHTRSRSGTPPMSGDISPGRLSPAGRAHILYY